VAEREARMRTTAIMAGLVTGAAMALPLAQATTAAARPGAKGDPVRAQASFSRGFAPATVVAAPGARVWFRSADGLRHSARDDRASARFSSGRPTSGEFSFRAPRAPGTYRFHCTVHAFMHGRLVVRP
jgi:plastocyanin